MPSYTDVLSRLKKGDISGVYFFHGTETYFIQQLKQQLKQAVIGEDEDNLSTYNLEETPIQDVIADAETYPLFGENKLIFADQPVFLQSSPRKLPFQHDLDALQAYAENPAPYSTLVMLADYEKIDNRKKVSKTLNKHAVVVPCEPIKPYEMKKWLRHTAKSAGVTLEQEAAEMLEANLSTNLYMMQNELTKLASFVGEGGTVTKETAEKLLAESTEQTALQLVDTVIQGDLAQAISIHRHLLNMKEDPIGFVALMGYHFRILLQLKRLKQKGYSQGQIQQQLSVHPYVVKINDQRERYFKTDQLENILIRLAETDAVLKQGGMDKQLASELLLHDIIQMKHAQTT